MTVNKRFRALRFIAIVLKILAWLAMLAGIVTAGFILATGVATSPFDNEIISSTSYLSFLADNTVLLAGAVGFGTVVTSLFFFLISYSTSEAIYLQLSIEENTRLTSMLLHKINEDDSSDSTSEQPSY